MNKKSLKTEQLGKLVIYKSTDGPEIQAQFKSETIWLTQQQIAQLFGTKRPAVTKHLNNIFKTAELSENSVCSILEHMAPHGQKYKTKFYNLDAIISVGYRVNSTRATQFRIWATQLVKDHLLRTKSQPIPDHPKSLIIEELIETNKLIKTVFDGHQLDGYEDILFTILTDYIDTWTLLYKYDQDKLFPTKSSKEVGIELEYSKVNIAIERFKSRLIKNKQASELFGREVSFKLKALLGNIEQTYDGKPIYKNFEIKAAHLLYFVIKDHPFADGNKRIGSLLFILYLVENDRLYNSKGERVINDSALTALALLVAESNPNQKEVMVNLVASLLVKK